MSFSIYTQVIHKNIEIEETSNYCQILILNIFSKVSDRIVLDRMISQIKSI